MQSFTLTKITLLHLRRTRCDACTTLPACLGSAANFATSSVLLALAAKTGSRARTVEMARTERTAKMERTGKMAGLAFVVALESLDAPARMARTVPLASVGLLVPRARAACPAPRVPLANLVPSELQAARVLPVLKVKMVATASKVAPDLSVCVALLVLLAPKGTRVCLGAMVAQVKMVCQAGME